MERRQGTHVTLPVRVLLTAIMVALAWLVVDILSSASSASASTQPTVASPAGTDDSVLGGILDPAAPVVAAVDGHVGTVAVLVSVPEPVRDAVKVTEVVATVDTTVTEVVAAVPAVEAVVVPVVTAVEPVVQPVLEPIVDQIASPVLAVVAPVVNEVVAPVAGAVVTPIVDTVVTPVVDNVVRPVVGPAIEPNAATGIASPAVPASGVVAPPVDVQVGSASTALSRSTAPATNPFGSAGATFAAPHSGTAAVAAAATMTDTPVPVAPAAPSGSPLAPVALPASPGGSITSSGTGNGPLPATTTPSGLLPAPDVRFHTSHVAGDVPPTNPSFDPGSTPD